MQYKQGPEAKLCLGYTEGNLSSFCLINKDNWLYIVRYPILMRYFDIVNKEIVYIVLYLPCNYFNTLYLLNIFIAETDLFLTVALFN